MHAPAVGPADMHTPVVVPTNMHTPVVDPNATRLTASDFAPPTSTSGDGLATVKETMALPPLDAKQTKVQADSDLAEKDEKDSEAWYTTPLGVAGIIGMAAVVGVVGYSLAQNGTLLPGALADAAPSAIPGATFGAADGQSLFSKSALGAGAANTFVGSSNILKDLELL